MRYVKGQSALIPSVLCFVCASHIEYQNACDQIVFYAFHSFLVEVQKDAGNIRAAHAELEIRWQLCKR